MILDGSPITEEESAELKTFLASHQLPCLENVPFVQRLLLDDMRRFQAGKQARYITFSAPEKTGPPATSSRTAAMKAMRLAGFTLKQIADKFALSQERVRQLIESMPRPQPYRWPRKQLARAMKQWLWDAGYRKCTRCQLWKPDVTFRRCKECNQRKSKEYYYSRGGKEKQREWQRAHPEERAAAARRWRAKNKLA